MRAQRGEEAAFAALFNFKAYNRRIYSVCLRMTGSQAEAEDLTQEVFLKLFRKIATFRGKSRFSTWLHRLAVNEVLMYLRRKRLDTVSLDGVDASRGDPLKPEYRREYGNDDLQPTGTVDRITLEKTVAELPPGFRTAFVLYDLSGYQHSEIARIMNCSVCNSKSQLHKARRRPLERRESICGGEGASTPSVCPHRILCSCRMRTMWSQKKVPSQGIFSASPGIFTLEGDD